MVVFGNGVGRHYLARLVLPGQYTYTSVVNGLYRRGTLSRFQKACRGMDSPLRRAISG